MSVWLLCCILLCNVYITLSAPFTPGNFVISRAGDKVQSALTISGSPNFVPAFLDEYTKDGTLVQTISLTCYVKAIFGGNLQQGDLQLSQDGTMITFLCTKSLATTDSYDVVTHNATAWRTTSRMTGVNTGTTAYSAMVHAGKAYIGFTGGTVSVVPFGLSTTGTLAARAPSSGEVIADLQMYNGVMQYLYRGYSSTLLATSPLYTGPLLTPTSAISNTDSPSSFKFSRYSDTVLYVCQTFGVITDIRLRKFVNTGGVWGVGATKALYPSLTSFPGGIVTRLESGKVTIYINTVEGVYKLVDTGSSDINPSNLTTVFTISTAHAALLDISLTPNTCNNGIKDGPETDVDCGGGCSQCADGKLCLVNADCVHNGCNPSTGRCGTCTDSFKNGAETDVDCGGGTCPACGFFKKCIIDRDCLTNACSSGFCVFPTCTDHKKNQDETDVDCGGTCRNTYKCANGKSCLINNDCQSLYCNPLLICATSTCNDTYLNQAETDVDCGGSCAACVNGKKCLVNTDCTSNYCNPDKKCSTPSCSDGYKNQDELGIDCGGVCGVPCNDGTPCTNDADCSSGFCSPATHTCRQPTCNDTFMNQYETDVDCGGTCGATCEDGKNCTLPIDCVSNYCNPDSMCSTPACDDSYLNQNETDLDCGGVCGATCVDGLQCNRNNDCVSNYCNPAGNCSTPACNDTYFNQDETDLDCGGVCGATCVDGLQCKSDGDCINNYCNPNGKCSTPMCPDTWLNNNETDVDCGGSLCELKCEDNKKCREHSDCASDFCNANGLCATPTCIDDALNGNETDVDCGGGTCGGCEDGKKCIVESDCLSAMCVKSTCISNRPTTRLEISLGSVNDAVMGLYVILALFNMLFDL